MSQVRNQYYKNTDQKIQKALIELLQDKDINKITVKDICNRANINRSTFYAHYIDIYDLMDKTEDDMGLGVLEVYKDSDISLDNFFSERRREYLTIMIRYIGHHRNFYKAYLKIHQNNDMMKAIQPMFELSITPYFKQMGLESEKDRIYHLSFFYNGMFSVIKQWIDAGCEETPEHLSNLIWNSITELSKIIEK